MSPASGMPREKWLALSYDALRDKNLALFRKLNAVLFPVAYSDKFYADCMQAGKVTQMAYTLPTDMLVGGIACRYERPAGGAGATRLYIMSLGVLAPYRGRGVGQRLLVRALAEALREGSAGDVYLHVQINNEDAIAFYKKFGFEVSETIEGYYKRLEPSACYVLSRSLRDWTPPPGLLALEADDAEDRTMDAP